MLFYTCPLLPSLYLYCPRQKKDVPPHSSEPSHTRPHPVQARKKSPERRHFPLSGPFSLKPQTSHNCKKSCSSHPCHVVSCPKLIASDVDFLLSFCMCKKSMRESAGARPSGPGRRCCKAKALPSPHLLCRPGSGFCRTCRSPHSTWPIIRSMAVRILRTRSAASSRCAETA